MQILCSRIRSKNKLLQFLYLPETDTFMVKILHNAIALYGKKYFATLITCQKLIDILEDCIAMYVTKYESWFKMIYFLIHLNPCLTLNCSHGKLQRKHVFFLVIFLSYFACKEIKT